MYSYFLKRAALYAGLAQSWLLHLDPKYL